MCGRIALPYARTMSKTRTLSATQFKAECLALLDRVANTREVLVVTKRGKPVAQVVPLPTAKKRSLLGSVQILGDIVAPLDELWDANR
jgi:prevent-host-death family protein